MASPTQPAEISVAELHANTEAIIRDLQQTTGILVFSETGKPVAWLAPIQHSDALTPEDVRAILAAYAAAEREDPSQWIAHEDFMRELEEDERRAEEAARSSR